MPKNSDTVNFNTILLTALLGLVGYFGNRIIATVDDNAKTVITHTDTLKQHGQDIQELQSEAKDTIHRPEYEHFKSQVMPKIGLTSNITPKPVQP